jgi:ATP-dependent DNA helicase PIF1
MCYTVRTYDYTKHQNYSRIFRGPRSDGKHGPAYFFDWASGNRKINTLGFISKKNKEKFGSLGSNRSSCGKCEGANNPFFFGFKPDITYEKVKRVDKGDLYGKLETLIIDEISMVRADLMDCVDKFLRLNGPYRDRPFGGVQMILIGDLYQLPPVVTGDERAIFASRYETPYFFFCQCLCL